MEEVDKFRQRGEARQARVVEEELDKVQVAKAKLDKLGEPKRSSTSLESQSEARQAQPVEATSTSSKERDKLR